MKIIKPLAMAASALLVLAACSSPTGGSKSDDTTGTTGTAFPLTFEASTIPCEWTVAAGYQNGATIPALALDTSNHGVIDSGGRNYLRTGSGTKTWPDSVDLGNQTLKFILRTDTGTGGGSHVVVSLKNLDLSSITGKTGIEYYLYIPQAPTTPLVSVGAVPILRYNDGQGTADSENHVVFSAPLNDPTAEDFTNSGSVYDWVYFGDGVFLHFKVPFDCFSVPGWAPTSTNTYATIADALAANVHFNQFTIDFRIDTADNGAVNTDYPAYLDNVGFY